LCLLDNRVPWTPPHGVLTSDVDGLTHTVNAQRVHHPDPDTGCGGVGAPAWAMVFSYDDGTRTITGDNGGCWDLLVGATERYGSKRVFAAFVQRVLSQRDGQSPARFRAGPPPCSRRAYRLGTFDPVADARTARTAALCLVREGPPRRILLTRHQLAALRHDFATSERRMVTGNAAYRCRTKNPMTYVVRGLDAWREPFTVDAQCGVYRILRPGETRYTFARLLPRSERMLTRLARS
jgi:hypothetical protein